MYDKRAFVFCVQREIVNIFQCILDTIKPEMHRPAYVIVAIADARAPNRRHAIGNHIAESSVIE